MKSVTRHILTTTCLLLFEKPWLPRINQVRMATGTPATPVELKKSADDQRLYRGLNLNNGLKVVLVSDPTTDKASAALDVHVGHMSDPWELPGLAHFLEHMLFLGTEKYPDENEYNQFLSQHGNYTVIFVMSRFQRFLFFVPFRGLVQCLHGYRPHQFLL